MKKELEKLRDELTIGHDLHDGVLIQHGFDAAIEHLSKAAGEFDEKACNDACHEIVHSRYRPDLAFFDGARWQFESMKARVGLCEHNWRELSKDRDELERKIKALEADNAKLYDRAITAEGSCETYQKNANYDQWRVDQLESQLLTTKENSTKLVGELEAEVARLKDTPGGKLLYAAWNEIQELKAEIARDSDEGE